MAVEHLIIDQIIADPAIRGGKPIIAGTGIRVMDIVLRHTTGAELSVEQIAETFQLTRGQVHAALAYYYLHQMEIDAQIKADDATADRLIADLERQGKLRRSE
ncbi:MAG: DUF433 domain-containing protein [Anaerolineae bacterium]|nr:DUF433 domain-containing protein [Anaerolineae bacterium]